MQSAKLHIPKPKRTRSKPENLRRNITITEIVVKETEAGPAVQRHCNAVACKKKSAMLHKSKSRRTRPKTGKVKKEVLALCPKKSAAKKKRRIQSYGGVAVLLHATATWTQQCCTKSKSRKAKSKTGKIKKSIDVAFQALIIKNEESYPAVQMRFSYVARNLQSTMLHLTEPGRGERRLKKMKNHHDISRSLRSKGQI